MAMPDGTGVATYGVALVEALRALDFAVEGVFGLPAGGDRQMREILFFEALERGLPERWGRMPQFVRAFLQTVDRFFPVNFRDVPVTGLVERRPFRRRLPEFDRIRSSWDLFGRADRHFEKTGRFLTVRMLNPPDVMHWTYPVPIRVAGARNLYTLHDMVPLRLPYATLDRKRAYRRLVRRCVRHGAAVVTVSENSRRDVIDLLGADPVRVRNTYQAVPDMPAPPPGASRAVGLEPGGYHLYFGAVEPKKNVGRLLEAFLASRAEAPLVLVGARAWAAERELRLLSAGGAGGVPTRQARHLARRVIRLDYLPRRLLMGLVRDARSVFFPSLYEGFGLPVLEAMALGTPVLTSDGGSLPEVAGDAALIVDPYDVAGMAAAIARLDSDADLRADLAARGPARAALFSAERYRERLAELYRDVLA